jgi:hypothetical protein
MNSSESEGLGLSVLIYITAIFGGLAALSLPVYLAVKPTVFANPPLAQANPLLNGPVIGERDIGPAPLALLKHRTMVDPKLVAALNAKVKNRDERGVPHQVAQQKQPRGQSVAELPAESRRPTSFLQLLFGG